MQTCAIRRAPHRPDVQETAKWISTRRSPDAVQCATTPLKRSMNIEALLQQIDRPLELLMGDGAYDAEGARKSLRNHSPGARYIAPQERGPWTERLHGADSKGQGCSDDPGPWPDAVAEAQRI